MLELELNEIKKDDVTLQSILNGLKETKINTTIGRLALSKSVCRFELPMDMKLLECESVRLTPRLVSSRLTCSIRSELKQWNRSTTCATTAR
jgi:hypothetical protein